jgi:hypothetical protein
MRLIKIALLSTLALAACRGGGSGDDSGDDTPPVDSPPGGVVKVKDVQNDAMPSGTAVELRGVVVTAIDLYGDRKADFFVQDVEGGEFSGIKVFGAPLDQVAAIQPGDIVDITNAQKDEFKFTGDTGSVTEIKGAAGGQMTVTKKSTGTIPSPVVVDAKAINAMGVDARKAEWEKWEGVLIKVTNARQLEDIATFGSTPGPDSTEFRITGVARVQSGLVELPATGVFGVCYESITGVGDHFFNDIVLPRSAADLVPGGTGCNAMANSITQAQTGANIEVVEVTDVFVTAVTFNKKNFWVSTSLNAAPNEGIFVFRGTSSETPVLPPEIVVGAKLTLRGSISEFDGNGASTSTITQLTGWSVVGTVTAPTAAMPVAVTGLSVADLNVGATGEPYESVLVTLPNVKVVDAGTSANFFVGTLQSGATTFASDDDILRLLDADENKCFDITGVWSFLAFSNKYGLLPISKVETTTPCP